ncbi:MAG TPA: phosphomevalonate kinase [Microbacteriaceae bacterium]|nr:phosphomevalonate kinase [Microbacteriaceae bacterium]
MNLLVKAPGKLFIAGEYAVIEPGSSAVLVAVNRYISLEATESEDIGRVFSTHFSEALTWQITEDGTGHEALEISPRWNNSLIAHILKTLFLFSNERSYSFAPLKLTIKSELERASGEKYGLGSSAALAVAFIKVFNERFQWRLSHVEIFKLALLATWKLQKSSSGADVASSTFGGWIYYSSPDRMKILNYLREHGTSETVAWSWPKLQIEPFEAPQSIKLTVAWSGSPAVTDKLINRQYVDAAEKEGFVSESNKIVDALYEALLADDAKKILLNIKQSKTGLLKHIGRANLEYETPMLATIDRIATENDVLAKISGAGGGDCAIAFTPRKQSVTRMIEEWKNHGIVHLSLSVTEKGKV